MKLATYSDGSRDGQLVVVSRDLSMAHHATGIATRLQQVLDDWNFLSPQLQDLSVTLNHGRARHAFAFEPRQCMAPLPRAFQCVQATPWPLPTGDVALLQRPSDALLGPCQDAWFGNADWQIDFGAGLAVVTGDVVPGADETEALDAVRLLMLANAWQLHAPPAANGWGPAAAASLPAAAFGPVAVTPDELGPAWHAGRLQGVLQSAVNGRTLGVNASGSDMAAHFGMLIARLAQTRALRAGSIVLAAPVANADAAKGFGCLAARRAAAPEAPPPWLVVGDRVHISLTGSDGQQPLGSIDQRVAGPVAETLPHA